MKIKYIVTLILFIIICSANYASIGETQEQCTARYGEPIPSTQKPGLQSAVYYQTGFVIVIKFFQGKAASLCYMKKKFDSYNPADELSPSEIEQLLKSNASGWQLKDTDTDWTAENGALQARYNKLSNHALMVATMDEIVRLQNNQKLSN